MDTEQMMDDLNLDDIPEKERFWVELEKSFREVESMSMEEQIQAETVVSEIWNRTHNNGRID